MRCHPSSICFWADHSKKVKSWKVPQNRFYFELLPFGSLIYVKWVQHLPEHMGSRWGIWRTYWGIHWELGEHIGNLMGTRENCKKSLSKPPLPPVMKKEKMQGTLSACLGLRIGCMKFLFPKEFITIFGLSYTSHKSNVFLLNLICPWQKKIETMKATQNRRFYGYMKCLPHCPSYIGEKGRTLGKTYGIQARCGWEDSWRTHWEPVGNKGKWEKSSSFAPPPSPRLPKT